MRFQVDENLPIEIADLLRQHQNDALTVPEEKLAGYPDPNLAQTCQKEERALVTLNLIRERLGDVVDYVDLVLAPGPSRRTWLSSVW